MRFAAAVFPQTRLWPAGGRDRDIGEGNTAGKLTEFYQRHYRPNRSIMAVVGDISHEEMTEALNQAFRSWNKGEPPPKPLALPAAPEIGTIRVHKDLTQAKSNSGSTRCRPGKPRLLRASSDELYSWRRRILLAGNGFHPQSAWPGIFGL